MKGWALVLALLPLAASAATITVNTTADNTAAGDGHCTLREAIANVNAAADTTSGDCVRGTGAGDTIAFQIEPRAIVSLTLGQLTVTQNVTIIGPTTGTLTLDGASRVVEVAAGTLAMSNLTISHGLADIGAAMLVDAGAIATLNDCTLSHNTVPYTQTPSDGGALAVAAGGAATLTNCVLSQNSAPAFFGSPGAGAVSVHGTLTLAGCTVTKNDGSNVGGIYVASGGAATLSDSTLSGNSGFYGGGGVLVAQGTATLINCTLRDNNGFQGLTTYGGAISVYEGTATLTNCTLSNNRASLGGAVATLYGSTTLVNCFLRGNTAQYAGGAIYNDGDETYSSTTTIISSVLQDNRALKVDDTSVTSGYLAGGGAVYNASIGILSDCTLRNNRAGNDGGALISHGTTNLTNCTLHSNRAQNGGGIFIGHGTTTLSNCTVRSNRAKAHGGGIANNGGDATLTNCTLSANGKDTPGGECIYNDGTSLLSLRNTIVANGRDAKNCAGSVYSGGHNLTSDTTCFTAGPTDLVNTRPRLAPLRNYGGATQTMALCTGRRMPHWSCAHTSPAIDAGDDSVTGPPDNLTTDQRGLPRLSGAHVDIGAYEVQQ